MNVLLLAGIALLVRFGTQSATVFTKQGAALLLAATGPLLGNLLFYIGAVPFNLAPVMFVFSALLLVWAILWTGFLDLVPIGRNAVVTDLNSGVVIVDRDHRVIDTNESCRRIFHFEDADSLVGRHIDDVLAGYPPFRAQYWSLTDGDADHDSLVEFEGRYYSVEAIPLGASAGKTLGHTIVIRDVTDQTLREQELERKNEQLERFASVISHDIRNPLNVIQGRVEVARREDAEPHLDTIAENADRIEHIIEDALVITRSERVLDSKTVNIETIARRAWGHVDTDDVTLETDCDLSVEGDPARLVQLFENLFRNAVEHGGDLTTVRVGLLRADDDSGFFVEDDGIGISEADRETILEDGYTTSVEGTGLGLSIIAEIIDTHDWRINVTESEAGGARFEIERANPRAESGVESAGADR